MTYEPRANTLLSLVSAMLKERLLPVLDGALAYQVRVAANALDVVQREIEQSGTHDEAVLNRLRKLLSSEADIVTLEQALSDDILAGRVDLEDPRLLNHLWADVMERLAIDQPTYSSYRAQLAGEPD